MGWNIGDQCPRAYHRMVYIDLDKEVIGRHLSRCFRRLVRQFDAVTRCTWISSPHHAAARSTDGIVEQGAEYWVVYTCSFPKSLLMLALVYLFNIYIYIYIYMIRNVLVELNSRDGLEIETSPFRDGLETYKRLVSVSSCLVSSRPNLLTRIWSRENGSPSRFKSRNETRHFGVFCRRNNKEILKPS